MHKLLKTRVPVIPSFKANVETLQGINMVVFFLMCWITWSL